MRALGGCAHASRSFLKRGWLRALCTKAGTPPMAPAASRFAQSLGLRQRSLEVQLGFNMRFVELQGSEKS
jgi:hypothetical protein